MDYWNDIKPRIEREFHEFDWWHHFGFFLPDYMKRKIRNQLKDTSICKNCLRPSWMHVRNMNRNCYVNSKTTFEKK